MYSLKKDQQVIVDLPGATITCRPATTASLEAARAAAGRRKTAILANPEDARKAGLTPDDMADKDVMEALPFHLMILELGRRHITGWTGFADETGEAAAPVTPENIDLVLRNPGIAYLFYNKISAGPMQLDAAKKDSGTAATGTTAPAPVPPTAGAAPSSTSPAAEGSQA